MKTKLIVTCAVIALLPIAGFTQPNPPNPPNPPSPPPPPNQPGPPRDRDEKVPKIPVTYLGVETSEVPRVVSEQLGLSRGFGLVVDYVVPNGPAATAGVQQNDILKMLNDQILTEPSQLSKLIRSYNDGTTITLTVLRKGQEQKISVKLSKKDVPQRNDWGHMRHTGDMDFGDLGDQIEGQLQEQLGNMKDGWMHDVVIRANEQAERIRDQTEQARERAREAGERAREQARAAGERAREQAREAAQRARDNAQRVRDQTQRARDEAQRVRDEEQSIRDRHAGEISITKNDENGLRTTTRIDLRKAQIVYSDDKGELRIDNTSGKKILTAKDPQGRLLFSGPVETQEDMGKIPADVRERFDKLQQKDLPSVISEGAAAQEEEDSDSEDMDEDDDNSVGVEQISVPTFPVNFSTFRTVLL